MEKWHRRKLVDEVSVIKSGDFPAIYIPRSFAHHFKENYVTLWYDEDEQIIGLKPSKHDPHGYKIIKQRYYITIRCSGLLRKLGVQPGRYKAWWSNEHNMLIFKYTKPIKNNGHNKNVGSI